MVKGRKPTLTETLEERKIRYKLTKQENDKKEREKRIQEKKEHKVQSRRLAFIQNIYKSLGYNTKTFSQKCGVTQQAGHWIFEVKDDCPLKRAIYMLDCIGIELKVEIRAIGEEELKVEKQEQNDKELQNFKTYDDITYLVEGDFSKKAYNKQSTYPVYITECKEGNTLKFLADFIIATKAPLQRIYDETSVTPGMLRYDFINGDIRISQLYEVAKAIDGQIVWMVNKKKD